MLKELFKRHNYWVKLVQKFGEHEYAEDIVQEMYLKLDRYIKEGIFKQTPPTSYVYLTLRSITGDYHRQKNKVIKVGIEDIDLINECNLDSDYAYNKIVCKLDEISKDWHWFDKMLFKLYRTTGKSIRDISNETSISVGTVFHCLKRCKQSLRDELGEDYEDYINQDYERL
jgi:RNA polymerase sigma factor (sigma-70 family)